MAALRLSPETAKSPRSAAVLVPLIVDGVLSVLFEVRSRTVPQPGEVCFPGGGVEAGESPEAAALRETWEELGIPAENVSLLGALSTQNHLSGKQIYPLVGEVAPESLHSLRLSTQEVAQVFTVPVDWLRTHPPKRLTYDMVPDLETVPEVLYPAVSKYRNRRTAIVWEYEGHVIWGLTARILEELLEKLEVRENEE